MDVVAAIAATPVVQTFRERSPLPRLGPYVRSIWIQQVPRHAPAFPHRTAPNGSAELICQPGNVPVLVGPQSGPTEQVLPPGTVAVGARLRPGALPAIFGIPAGEFVDRTVRLDDVCGHQALAMAGLVAEARSPADAASAMETAVLARLMEDSATDPVVDETVRRLLLGQFRDIAALADDVGISPRHLRRRCEAATGFSPKPLDRFFRLQRFLALTRRYGPAHVNLAFLAAEAGFADQAHLSRECLQLTGRSPRTALHEAEHNCEGLHDHRASDAPLLASIPATQHEHPALQDGESTRPVNADLGAPRVASRHT